MLLLGLVSAATPEPTTEGPPERPLLAPWLRRTSSEGRLVLEYGDEIVVLGGAEAVALLEGLLPLLDGTRTAAEAAERLGVRPRTVEAVVARLRAHGLVVSGPRVGEAALLCSALARGSHPRELEERLAAATVAVVGGSACARELVRLLAPVVGEVEPVDWEDASEADVAAAAPAPAELPRLAGWNETMLARRLPWLQVLPFNGRFAALGPLFVPGETCCEECFRRRRGAALGETRLLAELDRAPASYPEPQALGAALAGLAATLLLQWLATREGAAAGTLFALELDDGVRVDAHRVLRVPRCAACSRAVGVAPPLPWGAA